MAALRSFLELTSYFSKFLPNYATLVAAANESFVKLRTMLLESPALAIYDPKLPSFITTDASDYGSAVLTQLQSDNTERIVAFASRTLSAAERKYATTEKEVLACVWAVERWRTYV